jgi:hypothetical protein
MQMSEQRGAIESAKDLYRVRETEKNREREDDEGVLERLSDLSACAHDPPPSAYWRESLARESLTRARVERDHLNVLRQGASRDR